jgi:hypothetical protein
MRSPRDDPKLFEHVKLPEQCFQYSADKLPAGWKATTKESENSTMIGVLRSETADDIRQLQIQLSAGKIPTSAKLVKISDLSG